MDLFLQTVVSFPTVVFSVLLLIVLGYWLLAMLGLIDLDVIDVASGEGGSVDPSGLAGFLLKFGLDGIPITLIISTIVLVSWVFSYLADYALLRDLPADALRHLFGTGAAIAALLAAVPTAGLLLRPFAKLFAKIKPANSESLLGQICVIRSPEVTPLKGQAAFDDGGAGLILQVRADPGQFKRGDRAVLVEYLSAQNAYRIIKEA